MARVRPTFALVFVAVLSVWLLAGCPPTETPGYSPDSKQIALAAYDPGSKKGVVWLYDVARKTATPHIAPDDWDVWNVQWVGGQLWVTCGKHATAEETERFLGQKPATTAPVVRDWLITSFDPAKDDFVPGAPRVTRQTMIADFACFTSRYNGRDAIFIEGEDADSYDVYTLPELKTTIHERLNLLPAGRGWNVRLLSHSTGAASEIVAAQVEEPGGKVAATISAKEMAAACFRNARFPRAARISPDQSVVALAFNTETIFRRHPRKYTFGVFEIKSGKLLWAGGTDSIDGIPLVQRDQAWAIELVDRKVYLGERTPFDNSEMADPPKDRFQLVRHRPGEESGQWAGQRDVIFVYDLEKGTQVRDFAASPDGSHFLVTGDGLRPQLLFVPIRGDARPKDVTAVKLGWK